MEKTYIFKTENKLEEITLRGAIGVKKLGEITNKGKLISVSDGSLVVTIITKYINKEDLQKILN